MNELTQPSPQGNTHVRVQHQYQKSSSIQNQSNPFILDVNLEFPGSGVTAIFGHSGSGKTTLLRCIAGLEKPNSAKIIINHSVWQDESTFRPTHQRPLGYVFQDSLLFEHLTARGNLNYASKRAPKQYSTSDEQKIIQIMGIESILDQYPHQLSGGETQRVAIARALLIQPELLILDEPLASLDRIRKQAIIPYLEQLKSNFAIPIIYVSHSINEVSRLADQVFVLDQGKVIAQGTVKEVFSRIDLPNSFDDDIGVILQGTVINRDEEFHLIQINFGCGKLWVKDGGDEIAKTVRVRILAKDISLALSEHQDSSILNRFQVEIVDIKADHDISMVLVRLKCRIEYFIARITKKSLHQLNLKQGSVVWAQVKSAAVVR
ncbi:molybdenum ABC transporter ATP-binding protein [Aliikangiella maris]|uniref:Molybdenum ABC transporter ATP-binding protein n=2 Tax=Aliikangiella maris TaxID=3162458 RepID=A0ABV2BZ52_9GAMM